MLLVFIETAAPSRARGESGRQVSNHPDWITHYYVTLLFLCLINTQLRH